MKISFLASHGGSSARAIIDAIRTDKLDAEIGVLITNNRDSNILQWCLDNDIEVHHISAKTHRGEDNADEAIQTVLRDANTDLVVCSGYMKKIGPATLRVYPYKILNIHPALLPKFGGIGMYGDHVHRAVLDAGEKESGATVHYVTDNIDEGPIIKQQIIAVDVDDTIESLRNKVQSCEAELYLSALQDILKDE
ncbi:MAG: phosphoribosylglycinamide formyltransferase [SAR86 cluster bacterium]|uniref:Phosphoribosylglycinamide formyltransferase n=1 Tax=SAR86 cluster bacterium TaxID=2030880 RepID=A0A2A5CGN6_9GAMM|nr:MAG: phosphoribosylglycinamide formyltransferase [SAR86 cluster bacterium]